MRRYPLFDPPEYQNWTPDPQLVQAYRARLEADAERLRRINALSEAQQLALYEGMVRFRLHDYALKRWVRQGVISKAWLGTGEEAVTIGCVHALDRTRDIVAPMIRNAGALHEMGMTVESMLHGYLATVDSPNHGFDGHIGDLAKGVIQPISHVGQMVPIVTGMALAFQQRGEPRVALTWIGDGTTKVGTVHEGLNLAAIWKVPALFVVQNNQVALGTRLEQHQVGDLRAWGAAYGMPLLAADGNNVLDVYAATRIAAERARSGGGPSLLVVDTFRMGGHATHDEAEARATFAAELFEYWGKRDPIALFEEYLVGRGSTRERLAEIERMVSAQIDQAAEHAAAARTERMPVGSQAELAGVSAGVRQPGLQYRIGTD
jgi:TPP-dependent pyruvate/acetoin dehydrogenase alpha subunit